MRWNIQRGKKYLCLVITLFFLSLYIAPFAREGKAIFAYNFHNLGRVFDRMVQLPEEPGVPFGPIGRENRDYFLRVF